MSKLRIALVSSWYPVSMSRYFEAALKRREDVDLRTVGPYTGSWIPWNFGMHLPDEYAIAPDILVGPANTHNPPKMAMTYEAEARLPWKPDIWIQVDGGFSFANKPTVGKNIFVATDPHVINYGKQRALADEFYCMQTPYMANGDKYLPYAHDPIWHGHYPEKEADKYDVALVGLHYQHRTDLINNLRNKGMTCYYDLGPAYDKLNDIYHGTQIGINWSSLKDLTARVFELTGMKRLAVVNHVPDLDKFFVGGQDLIVFNSLSEAVEKIEYYRTHRDEAQAIAQRGYDKVQQHTWDARVDQILNGKGYNE